MANQWLRLWHDMPTDPKWRTISRASGQSIGNVMAVYCHILVCASNADERGRTQSFNCEDVASALDIQTADVAAIVDAMQGRVLDGDRVAGWEKRQVAREDGAAERAKAWREAQKQAKQAQPNESERNRTQAERNQTPDKDTDKIKIKKERERGSRLPPDWTLPDEWAEWCRTARPDLDPDKVASKFADYWHGVSGKGGVKLDWLATWRNWVRDERAQFKAQPAEVSEWYETKRGVEKKAASLGMGPWVESEEQYPAYKARVMEKAKVQSKSFGLNLDQLAAMAAQRSGVPA